jgi:hypothetical protein
MEVWYHLTSVAKENMSDMRGALVLLTKAHNMGPFSGFLKLRFIANILQQLVDELLDTCFKLSLVEKSFVEFLWDFKCSRPRKQSNFKGWALFISFAPHHSQNWLFCVPDCIF